MADFGSVISFIFSACATFGNLWFSTFPINLFASVAVLALIYKLYSLLS